MSSDARRLIWFVHFHKAGGSSVVELARANGETLPDPHANGNALQPDGKIDRPWDLTASGLAERVAALRAAGVTFVATEWGVPDLDALTGLPGVVVVTVLRNPVDRLVSNFNFDRRSGFTRATSILDYVDHHVESHTQTNYYARQVLGRDWRSDAPPAELVDEAARRLGLLHHVAFLEDAGSLDGLADAVGWKNPPMHANRFHRDLPRRLRASYRHLRRGRVDLVRGALRRTQAYAVTAADLTQLRGRNALDDEVLAAVRAAQPVDQGLAWSRSSTS